MRNTYFIVLWLIVSAYPVGVLLGAAVAIL